MRLKGKVALFAGAGGGMGAATPLLFAQEGADIVLAARRLDPLEELASRIRGVGGRVVCVSADLVTKEGMARAVAAAEDSFGKLDICFNNLGDFAIHTIPMEETSDKQWGDLIGINLNVAYLCTRFAVPAFRRAGRGVLIHLAASHDIRMAGHPGYAASKMALIGLTQSTALAYRKDNIRIVCLSPNAMGNVFPDARVGLPNATLLRPGSSEDLAWAALFFASDEASWLTGVTLDVDGGNSLVSNRPAGA